MFHNSSPMEDDGESTDVVKHQNSIELETSGDKPNSTSLSDAHP